MGDTVTTYRPNADIAFGPNWTIGGGAPFHASATSDNDDATYSRHATTAADRFHVGMSGTAIPASSIIHSVTLRVRWSAEGAAGGTCWGLNVKTEVGGVERYEAFLSECGGDASIRTTSAPQRTTAPNGAPWTPATVHAGVILYGEPTAEEGTFRIYELYLDVRHNQAPTATPTAPTGIVATSRPTLSWLYSDPEGDAQERYRAKVFTAAQFGVGGFNPATSSAFWDSTVRSSSATSITNGPKLVNGTYRFYVQVADAGSGGRFSAWAYTEFTVVADPAAAPSIAAALDGANSRVLLTLAGRDNLLEADGASMETTIVNTWHNVAQTILDRTNAQALNGSWSIVAEAQSGIAGADMVFHSMASFPTGRGTTPVPYVDGVPQPITGLAHMRAATTGRTWHIGFEWRDGAYSVIGQTDGHDAADTTTGWTLATVGPVTAPAGAVYCNLIVTIEGATAGEVHYVDEAAIVPYAPNLLDPDAASLETSGDHWQDGTGGTFERVARALQGDHAAGIVATGAGTSQIAMVVAKRCAPVLAGETYSATAAFRLASAGSRSVLVRLVWLDAANATIATVDGPNVAATSDWWTFATVAAGVAPAGAVKARLIARFSSQQAGEVAWVDCAGVMPGTDPTYRHPPTWTPGGLVPGQTVSVERSADGGATWEPVRIGAAADFDVDLHDPGQRLGPDEAWDPLAPRGVELLYRAQTSSGVTISDTSPMARVAAVPVDSGGDDDDWLKNPLDPSMNMPICLEAPLDSDSTETQAVGEPVGGTTYRVARGDVRGEMFTLSLSFATDAEWEAFERLRKAQVTLLLQTRYGDGTGAGAPEQWYVALGPTRTVTRVEKGGGGQLRLVKIGAREVAAPAVP